MIKFNVKSTNRDLFYQFEEKLLEYQTEMVQINQTGEKKNKANLNHPPSNLT